jgi:protein ImuA
MNSASAQSLALLRRRIAKLDAGQKRHDMRSFATGHVALDAALDGGFAYGRLHELFGAEPEDCGSAAAFALLLAFLASGGNSPLLWLRTDSALRRGGMPYGPGLSGLGIDPGRLLLGVMPDDAMLLRAAADGLRCAALGAVVIECWGNAPMLDLTASRRLTLAAESSGVCGLLLRLDAGPSPSAAETRWRIASAPSVALAADAPGHSAFDISLLRRRAGPDGLAWRVEWNRDRTCFDEWQEGGEALSGVVVPLPAAGPVADFAA